MTNLDKISHNLMDSNHRLKAKCGLMEKEIERLSEENDKLKQSYIQLEHRHSLLHDVCLDAECDRDGYHKDVLSLEKENEQLKFKLEEVKSDEKQLEISFMEFKMKLIEKLQIHYDYATEQRQKNLNDIFVAKAYDIIRYDIKKLAEEMRVDLCELLNELHDEKESWMKSWIEELNDSEEQSKCIIKLANENEELKKEIQNLQAKLNILEQAITGDKKQ